MSCGCRKALKEIRDWPAPSTCLASWAMIWGIARAALATPCSCVADFIDQHSTTCDCCNHIMVDVTAAREGSEQHCIAGSEGDGMGCAHSWRQTVVTLEAEGDQLRAKVAELEAVTSECKRIVSEDESLGALVDLLFDAPLRAAEAECRRLRGEIAELKCERPIALTT